MAICEVCSRKDGKRVIEGIHFCEDCFGKLARLRNADPEEIDFFTNESNMFKASTGARQYLMGVVDKALEKSKLNEADRAELARHIEAVKALKSHLEDFIISSTPTLSGYIIEEYKGLAFGEVVVPNGIMGVLTSGTFFTVSAVEKARKMAVESMRENALQMEANAIVGVDVDISDLNGNAVIVSANGTAVKVRKVE